MYLRRRGAVLSETVNIRSIGMILAMGLLLLAACAAFDAFAKGMRLAGSTP